MRNAILGSAALAVLLSAGPALAAAFTVSPAADTLIPMNNDFKGNLAAEGLGSYRATGATITLNYARNLRFEFMGSESGNTNRFKAGSLADYTEFDKPWGSSLIGNENYLAGLISNWTFNIGSGNPDTIGSPGFAIFVPGAVRAYTSNVLYLGLDDFVNNADDNHDDFIVKVTAVPEPASWAMLIAGFGLVGMTARRRAMKEVTA
jgi:hypothetical protein